MEHRQRCDRYVLVPEPYVSELKHRLHQALATPSFVEESMVDVALEPRQITLAVAPQIHPQVTEESSIAVVGNPNRMMVAVEDRFEPIWRVTNSVPIEARTRIDRLMIGRNPCDQP